MSTAGFVYLETLAGTGENCPSGSPVTAHYHGTLLDGKVFDSSIDRNDPLKFTVGVGQVIPCWDQGITQMKVGGKATLTCPPELAYGERGAGGVIGPNATLKFDVELIACGDNVRADL